MSEIALHERYLTGDEKVDSQHKYLFSLLIKSYGEIDKESIIDELCKYAEVHFKDEESLMQKVNYNKADLHIKAHNQLKMELDKLVKIYRNTKDDFDIIIVFLEKWLKTHILNMDKELVAYIKTKKH